MKMSAANVIPQLHWWKSADRGKEKYPEKKKCPGSLFEFFLGIYRLSPTSVYQCFTLILK